MNGMFGIATPRKDVNKAQDHSDPTISFGDVASFVEPGPKESQRVPLRARSDNPRKGTEFTPLLKTATKKNRMMKYETPIHRADTTVSSTAENSALTPVLWKSKHSVLGSSQMSSTPSKASPDQSEVHEGAGGIREQEKAMDKMKKQNWELKLKIFLLEQQAHQSSPEHVQIALRENIDYKIQVSSLSRDIAKYKKALSDTEKKVASLGDQVSASISQDACQLQHGMSDEERHRLSQLENERATLLDEREDADMKLRDLEDELDQLTTKQENYDELEREVKSLNDKLLEASAASNELSEAQAAARQAQEEMQRLQEDFESLKSDYDDLLSQTRSGDSDEVIEVLREQLTEKNQSLQSLTSQLRESETRVSSLQSHLDTMSTRLSSVEYRSTELEAELESRSRELDAARASIESTKTEYAETERQFTALKDNFAAVSERCSDQATTIDGLQEQLRDRQEDIEELQGMAQDQSFEYRQLEQKLERQNGNDGTTTDTIRASMEEELSQSKLASREAEREIEQLRNKIRELEGDLISADVSSRARIVQTEDLEEQVAEKEAHIQSLNREALSYQQKIASWTARAQKLEEQLGILESNDDVDTTHVHNRLRDENAELRSLVENLEAQVLEKEEEIELLGDEVSQVNAELDHARTSSSQSSSTLENLQQQLEFSKAQLAELGLQLHSANDKVILTEQARDKLNSELLAAKQAIAEEEKKAAALNTSLLHVRTLLSETQASQKNELQAVTKAHHAEKSSLTSQCQDLEQQLKSHIDSSQRMLEQARVTKEDLERELNQGREQIASLEKTVRQLSENEDTINIDQARWRDALQSEVDRHQLIERRLQDQLKELEAVRDELRENLDSKLLETENLKNEIQKSEKSEVTQVTRIDYLDGQVRELEQALTLAKTSAQNAESDSNALSARVRDLELKLDGVQDTLSCARRDHQAQLLAKADELFAESKRSRTLASELNAKQSMLSQAEQEKERLGLAVTAADQRARASSQRVEDLTARNKSLEIQLQQSSGKETFTGVERTEAAQLCEKLSSVKEELRNALVELDETAAERDLLQDQLEDNAIELEEHKKLAEETLVSLRAAFDQAKTSELRETERANRMESIAADQLRETTSQARAAERQAQLTIHNLQESLESLKERHSDLLANIGISRAQEQMSDKLTKAAESRGEKLLQEKVEVEHRLVDTNHRQQLRIQELEIELKDLEGELADAKTEAAFKQSELEMRMQNEESIHSRSISRMERRLQDAREERDDLLQQRIKLEGEIADQKESIQILNGDLDTFKSLEVKRDSDHTQKLEAAQRGNTKTKQELASARQEIEKLRSNAALVESSSRRQQSESRLENELREANHKAKSFDSALRQNERKINYLKAYGKEKAELVATLERRYLDLKSQETKIANAQVEQSRKAEKKHSKDIADLVKVMDCLKAKLDREERFHEDFSLMKQYYDKQITSNQACTRAALAMTQRMRKSAYPDESVRTQRPSLRGAVRLVIATIRMRKSAQAWSIKKAEINKTDKYWQMRKLRQSGK